LLLIGFLLLLLASTIGGSSNMSESNQIVATGLALMALFGCAFFIALNILSAIEGFLSRDKAIAYHC
jgi:hypothetical protein